MGFRARHTLVVIHEDRPHKTRLRHWRGPKTVKAMCRSLVFPDGPDGLLAAWHEAERLAKHPRVRTVRVLRVVEQELYMVGAAVTWPIPPDAEGILGSQPGATLLGPGARLERNTGTRPRGTR